MVSANVCILSLAIWAQTDGALPQCELKPRHDFEAGDLRGVASLEMLRPETIRTGDVVRIDVRFDVSGKGYLYNPFLNRLLPLPARLALFDENRVYLGDMFLRHAGSRVRIGKSIWTAVEDGYLGSTAEIRLADPRRPERDLPPGKYFLQLILHERFATWPPIDPMTNNVTAKTLAAWRARYDDDDFARSNVVEFEIRPAE